MGTGRPRLNRAGHMRGGGTRELLHVFSSMWICFTFFPIWIFPVFFPDRMLTFFVHRVVPIQKIPWSFKKWSGNFDQDLLHRTILIFFLKKIMRL
jgi:hypothetical protein